MIRSAILSILQLVMYSFVKVFSEKHRKSVATLSAEGYQAILAYPWPGNVRELEHAIERAVLVAHGRELTLGDLPESLQHGPAGGEGAAGGGIAPSEVPSGSLEDIERASILKALDATRWNKQAAAVLLGLRRPTLYSKMRKHNIPQRRS